MQGNCFLCGCVSFVKLYKVNRYGIVKCVNCNFVYTTPLPSERELHRYYSKFDYSEPKSAEEAIRKDARRSLYIIERFSNKNGGLLDVGCGRGYFLHEARSRGWTCYGIDYSQKAVSYGRNVLRLDLQKADIFTYKTTKKFDVIILSQVIEHTSKPRVILEKCYKLLHHGGIIYIATPNIESISARVMKENFDHLIPPEHLGYFSKNTLTLLLKQIGFNPLYFGSWSYPADFAGIIKRALKIHEEKQIKYQNTKDNGYGRKMALGKRVKHFLFDRLFCGVLYRILNLNSFGINLEVVAQSLN